MAHPRVLFLPGASGAGSFWHPVAGHLPAARDTVFFDWPGLGRIPADPSVKALDDLVSLVLAEMRAPVDLVAQSMGGVVAVEVALQRPDLVRRLVLTATSGGLDTGRFATQDWRGDYVAEFPEAAPWIREDRRDLGHRLAAITSPTLLLWGDADRISPVAIGEHLFRTLPRAKLVVIEGGDHMFARDRADEAGPHIARHLAPEDPG